MGREGTSLILVEDEVVRHYLDCLGEFSRHYGIPTTFTGRSNDDSAISRLDVAFSKDCTLSSIITEVAPSLNPSDQHN